MASTRTIGNLLMSTTRTTVKTTTDLNRKEDEPAPLQGPRPMTATNPASPDLTELAELLASSRVRPGCFSLSKLDGFLAANVAGPVQRSARDLLPLIWGKGEPEWRDKEEAGRILAAVSARLDQMFRQVAYDVHRYQVQMVGKISLDPEGYEPILRTLPDGTEAADDWAEGFHAMIGLHRHEWRTLYESWCFRTLMVGINVQAWDAPTMEKYWPDFYEDWSEEVVRMRRSPRQAYLGSIVNDISDFFQRHEYLHSIVNGTDDCEQPRLH
jgi:yecA family protein